jgi:uncharacterized protein (DUF2235 family)
MAAQQRLIVCLDGTWNRQDSSTNVLHHFNTIREGIDPETGLVQRRYYHRGVGTGVLDSITGGGFGFGLEQNVRDAYNWLIEHYCDGENDRPPDEIYIFGFSRGAYTARSLVGFIGQCGLLRRGAPLTVDQLWDDYCILGRQKEERHSPWDKILWKPEVNVRQFTDLTRIQDHGGKLEAGERLLLHWSRRVNITYLGIYDTVGAMGWDALAIPGLTSRIAFHNNMRPTTLIQHCRHALALDEHRSSFNHTPFLAYVGNDERELDRGNGHAGDPESYWDRTMAMWNRKIEQRWFVGAHSNIGGGYPDNRLAERPFQWIVEGATAAGLAAETITPDPPPAPADQSPRDSYAEFAPPLWTKILRAKPHYRAVSPDPLPEASAKPPCNGVPAAGFSLHSIHEDLDDSVRAYYQHSELPLPPNLEEYLTRTGKSIRGTKKAAHTWLAGNISDYVWVVLWASFAAAGLFAVDQLIGKKPSTEGWIVACAIALFLPAADWVESRFNFGYARGWQTPFARALLDTVYWGRAAGFVLAVFGLIHVINLLVPMGWRGDGGGLAAFAGLYWPVPLLALAVPFITGIRSKAGWWSLLCGPASAAAVTIVLFGAGWLAHRFFWEIPAGLKPPDPSQLSIAGLLLALQLSLVYALRAMAWTGEPMAKANLGSEVGLQLCWTPNQVAERLERWRAMLVCSWNPEDDDATNGPAARRMRALLGESLYRDIFGFIPVYTVALLFGLWFGHRYVWPETGGMPASFWWLLPAVSAVTDYCEDACHLRYRSLHADGRKPSAMLTLFSFSMTSIKLAAFTAAACLTVTAVLVGTWNLDGQESGWRAKTATLITIAGLLGLLSLLVARAVHSIRVRR